MDQIAIWRKVRFFGAGRGWPRDVSDMACVSFVGGRGMWPTYQIRRPDQAELIGSIRPAPDIAVVHERDLAVVDLLAELGVRIGWSIEVQVLGIDRLLVNQLIQLGPQVFYPVVPLCLRP